MQSDYLAFRALSQHVAKMVQSHPQVPLQTLIVRPSNSINFSFTCADRFPSIFWCLIKDFSSTNVPVADEYSQPRDTFLQLGDYGFPEPQCILLIQMRTKQINPIPRVSQTRLPRMIQMDIGSRAMLHVCITEGHWADKCSELGRYSGR